MLCILHDTLIFFSRNQRENTMDEKDGNKNSENGKKHISLSL